MHKRVHVEFIFRSENGFRMKMGSFKKPSLKNCYKILKFANFENGGTDIQGVSCVLCEKSCQLLHCCWSITGLPISRCKKNCHTSLGFGDNRQTVSGRLGLLASLYIALGQGKTTLPRGVTIFI